MRCVFLFVIGATLLTGCAKTVYYNPDPSVNNTREFERHKRRCMNEAAIQAQAWGSTGNPFMIASDTKQCLEIEYGWIPQKN